ncbi:hypothetical protein Y032_0048g1651 [Ancylostoma ceylanicum]|uniref:Uncharacterized protein n=1 Tax=Ancylostoma ceylanicum TaxID=53326 RepID=A0A016UB53_9BILA|nr:hypothetical protein Y032_0048g1651 [Ancylostoma ceylanicum]
MVGYAPDACTKALNLQGATKSWWSMTTLCCALVSTGSDLSQNRKTTCRQAFGKQVVVDKFDVTMPSKNKLCRKLFFEQLADKEKPEQVTEVGRVVHR